VNLFGLPIREASVYDPLLVSTPLQTHLSDTQQVTADKYSQEWDMAIQRIGGRHAHGLHSLESSVYMHHDLKAGGPGGVLDLEDLNLALKLYEAQYKYVPFCILYYILRFYYFNHTEVPGTFKSVQPCLET
jgi:hypothetical protein